jgi:CelD/BcsL family acetyltransferase involved in cellulose biosynthesis
VRRGLAGWADVAYAAAVTLGGAILESPDEVGRCLGAWDALAVERGLPFCAPGWLLPWWKHVAPRGAELRVVVALDGEELVGIAPFFAKGWIGGLSQYGLIGAAGMRIEPLARADAVEAVAATFARTLAEARPVPASIRFEGLPANSPWPHLLGREWPGSGRPFVHVEAAIPAPVVTLAEEDFDAWMKSKSSNFRQQVRRSRRHLEQAGAVFRTAATAEEVTARLADFERLHRARWDPRGGSGVMKPGVMEMLRDAGHALVDSGRFRLESIEVDGRAISSQLFLSAGSETGYWLGGFDEEFAAQRPSMVALVAAVEKGFERGEARLDLGSGGSKYKYRLADSEDRLEWLTLIPPGPHHRRAMALFTPRRVRYAITSRMSPKTKARLRRLLRRDSSAHSGSGESGR